MLPRGRRPAEQLRPLCSGPPKVPRSAPWLLVTQLPFPLPAVSPGPCRVNKVTSDQQVQGCSQREGEQRLPSSAPVLLQVSWGWGARATSYASEHIPDATLMPYSTTHSIGPAMRTVLVKTRLLQRKGASPLRRSTMFSLRRPHERCVVI